ncbi:voltage-dependent potassium channel, beta subunit [Calocera viscosa TUFC12733]|uniref:Voltage-dependent potassium channel, beta subunit n=1 Tax=Calocera viscosa (strain TUFC12733) TaxID=1330018 RepID=A0A167NM93_CALVF|nr:voltage-dependent potassium channel, beta subunit [Calocera viscosa TUFC12733]
MSLPPMQYRFLGRSGLKVSVVSLGGWLTHGGHTGDELALQTMKRAYELGVNFFDSAEGYAAGKAELLLGKAIKQFGWEREDLVISTKLYWGEKPDGTKGVNDVGLSRKHILGGMRKSLARLQLEYVDLVFAHRPDRHTPMEEVVRAFNYLISTGQALYWGTSEWSAEEVADAWGVADRLNLIGPLMEQPEYNMLKRDRFEREYEPLFRKWGTGTTVFSPLRRGILTGKYDNGIPEDSRAAKEGGWFKDEVSGAQGAQTLARVKKLKTVSDKLGCTRAQLALAWTLANPHVSSAIIGATSVTQVDENIAALSVLDKLTPAVLEEIDAILENKPKADTFRYD